MPYSKWGKDRCAVIWILSCRRGGAPHSYKSMISPLCFGVSRISGHHHLLWKIYSFHVLIRLFRQGTSVDLTELRTSGALSIKLPTTTGPMCTMDCYIYFLLGLGKSGVHYKRAAIL
jgi:hypothetical protein